MQQQPEQNLNIQQEQEETKEDKSLFDKNFHYSFYLYVNPTSGGNKAAEFLKLETESLTFKLDNPKDKKQKYTVDMFFTNLFSEEEREKGFTKMREEIKKNKSRCRAVVCGGDGTVMWVVEEMVKYKVDIEQCPIGIVAFGTGNDFSRVLGWGAGAPGTVIGSNLSGLKKLVQKWIFSQLLDFDIWDISVVVDEEKGHFKAVKKDKETGKITKNPVIEMDGKKEVKGSNGEPKQLKVLRKHMSNYCSIGVDARIGYGFDKNRTKSQFGNKCVYAYEGFKKFFIKTSKMSDIVDNLEHREEQQESKGIVNKVQHGIEDIKSKVTGKESEGQLKEVDIQDKKSEIFFKSRPKLKKGETSTAKEDDVFLKGNPVSILCSNIPSYGGGAQFMWKKSEKKIGIETVDKKKPDEDIKKWENQNFGDSKLEFMAFANGIKLSLEQVVVGNSDRIAQGKGPFYLNFKEKDEKGELVKTYFQIDGEFYQAYNPKYIKFELAKALPRGKIKVMAENSPKK